MNTILILIVSSHSEDNLFFLREYWHHVARARITSLLGTLEVKRHKLVDNEVTIEMLVHGNIRFLQQTITFLCDDILMITKIEELSFKRKLEIIHEIHLIIWDARNLTRQIQAYGICKPQSRN